MHMYTPLGLLHRMGLGHRRLSETLLAAERRGPCPPLTVLFPRCPPSTQSFPYRVRWRSHTDQCAAPHNAQACARGEKILYKHIVHVNIYAQANKRTYKRIQQELKRKKFACDSIQTFHVSSVCICMGACKCLPGAEDGDPLRTYRETTAA
jgi:hypothetical protein